ncbi:MAG: cytochrome c3 family protein [Dehalococcoidia bacterium]
MSKRTRLLLKLGVPAGATLVVLAVAGFFLIPRVLGHYFWGPETFFRSAPEQPVGFTHVTHAQTLGIDCTFCHRTATTSAAATIPAVEQCMFCHQVVGRDNPEVQKVLEAWEQGNPIQWVRVHRLPDHVHFVHEAHLRVGIQCSDCHGDVGSMEQVRQVRSLRMGDCVDCHRKGVTFNDEPITGPTDCVTCHY